MPNEHEKIKYLPREKSLKVPFIIYADLECLLKKVQFCQNNPENSCTEKKVKHKSSGYAWCSICSFDEKKNRRYFYRGKDYWNGSFGEKQMIPLTNKESKSWKTKSMPYMQKKVLLW